MICLPASDAHECCDDEDEDPRKRCDSEDLPCSFSFAIRLLMSFSSTFASRSLSCAGREEDQARVLRMRDRSFFSSSAVVVSW